MAELVSAKARYLAEADSTNRSFANSCYHAKSEFDNIIVSLFTCNNKQLILTKTHKKQTLNNTSTCYIVTTF